MAQSTSTSSVQAAPITAATTACASGDGVADIRDRIKGALYGLFIADAMAMPTHWYYGGVGQVTGEYGAGVTSYVKPVTKYPGSIMSKSNTAGGGRGGFKGDIIGDVIFHGKKKYWQPGSDYFYHQSMEAGDNTLEPLLLRRVLAVTAATAGQFNVPAITQDYMKFMTTPGSHNDTYCGTCHRMFFANWKAQEKQLQTNGSSALPDPALCPDNDGHNVDNTDSIITTVPIALMARDDVQSMENVAAMVAITRKSQPSQQYAQHFSKMLREVVFNMQDAKAQAHTLAQQLKFGALSSRAADPVTA